MKQSNNAIKYLMAQYRAIYKYAYIKGVLSASVLALGLVAGSANASATAITAGAASWDQVTETNKVDITTDTSFPSNSAQNNFYYDISISGENGKLANGNTAGTLYIKNLLKVGTAKDTKTSNLVLTSGGRIIGANEKEAGYDTKFAGKMDATNAVIEVKDSRTDVSSASSIIAMHSIDLNGGQLTIQSDSKTVSAPAKNILKVKQDPKWHQAATVSANGSDATRGHFNITNNAKVVVSGGAILSVDNRADMNIKNSSIELNNYGMIRGVDNFVSTGFNNNIHWSTINLTNQSKLVASGSGNAILAVQGKFENSTIEVKADGSSASGQLILNGDFVKDTGYLSTIYENQVSNFGAGQFTSTNSTITIGSNSELLIGAGEFASGGKLVNHEASTDRDESTMITTLSVSGGKLHNSGDIKVEGVLVIDDSVDLHAKADKATITVAKNTNGNSNKHQDAGTLKISATQLAHYLTGNETGVSGDKAGTLVLSGGTVDLGNSSIILSDYAFTSGANANSINAGVIHILNGNNSNFKADTITIKHQLKSGATALGAEATSGMNIEVNTLNLGASNINSAESANIKFGTALVRNALNIDTDGSAYKLGGNITLAAYSQSADKDGNPIYSGSSGVIDGDDLYITSGTSLNVIAGDWSANQKITIESGGSLVVDTSAKNGETNPIVDASLKTQDIHFVLASNNKVATIKAKGSTNGLYDPTAENAEKAFIDLTQANISVTAEATASDTAVIEAVSGGIIALNADQMNKVFNDASSTQANSLKQVRFKADNGGMLQVNGSLEMNYTTSNIATLNDMLDVRGGSVLKADGLSTTFTLDNYTSSHAARFRGGIYDLGSLNISAKKTDGSFYDQFFFADGIVNIANSLSFDNQEILLKQHENRDKKIEINFATANSNDQGTISSTHSSGGVITLDQSGSDNKTSINIKNGKWQAYNTSFKLTNGLLNISAPDSNTNATYFANLEAYGLAVGAGGKVNIGKTGSATFNKLDLTGATADSVLVSGSMTIRGVEKSETETNYGLTFGGADGSIAVGQNAELRFVENAVHGIVTVNEDKKGITINTGFNKLKVDHNGEVLLDLSKDISLTADTIKQLKDSLFVDGSTGFKGFLNVGSANLGLEFTDTSKTEITWENFNKFSGVIQNEGITNTDLKNAKVSGIANNQALKGSVGSLETKAGVTSLTIDGNTALNNATAGKGQNFAADSNGKLVSLSVKNNSNLELANGGNAGDISLDSGSSLTTVGNGSTSLSSVKGSSGNFNVKSQTTVLGNVEVNNLAIDSSLDVQGAEVKVANLTTKANTQLKTNLLDISTGANIQGQASATELRLGKNANLTVDGSGLLDVTDLRVAATASNSTIYVGSEDSYDLDGNLVKEGSTGRLEADYATLNGATLQVDPSYDKETALAAISKFGRPSQSTPTNDIGIVDGNLYVGQNSALGLGMSLAELAQSIEKYQLNGKLQNEEGKFGSILYVNDSFTLADGKSIKMTHRPVDGTNGFNEYFTTNNKTGVTSDLIYFGEQTAMIVNGVKLSQTKPLITLSGKNNTLIADGGEIIISGELKGNSSYQVFSTNSADKTITVKTLNNLTAQDSGAFIEVSTENGFLEGVIFNDLNGSQTSGKVDLKVNEHEARSIMSKASDPVYKSILAYGRGYKGELTDTPKDSDRIGTALYEDPNDKNKVTGYKYHNWFLQDTINFGDGAAAEQVSRLGTYAGAIQSALSSSEVLNETIAARMGMGAQQGNLSFADNGQGAGFFVAPVYKNTESDSFKAQGVNYGVDLDMYGLALGGDYTLTNGLRLGLMFNVGSGDADGKGAGQGVSNDFDYYGIAGYAGFTYDKLSVVADVSYTVVDNEVKGTNSLAKVQSSFDSTALSLGLTAQYKLALNGLDVVPHAGLRFTSIDMDNYSIQDAIDKDVFAKYSADRLNVFSIPVGVSLSKDIVAGSWTIKPSFDLTLAGNFGDDSADGSVYWEGVENLQTNISTEVLDSFTYGASLGLGAKHGNFSMGLGVNYTGSSNTDSYGLNANARFVF